MLGIRNEWFDSKATEERCDWKAFLKGHDE